MFKSTTNNSKQFSPPSHHMQATIIQILFIMLLSLFHNDHDITTVLCYIMFSKIVPNKAKERILLWGSGGGPHGNGGGGDDLEFEQVLQRLLLD